MTGSAQDRRGPRSGGGVAFGSFNPTTITDARSGASTELSRRQKRYAITMAFRTVCFVAMIFVPGPLRWVLFACAVFLPYVAVLFANQADQRKAGTPVGGGAPGDAPAITTGPEHNEIISGDVDAGNHDAGNREEGRDDRVA